MSLFDFIGGLFKPATDLVDNLHTSTEEKMELQARLNDIEAGVEKEVLRYETKVMELQAKLAEEASKVAIAEASSDSIFTKSYRPAIICGLFLWIVAGSMGLCDVPEIATTVFGTCFGVIGVGRTAEKLTRIRK